MQSLFIAAALLLASTASSQAATVAAASCSQANVATALSTAARNDTVTVPSGSCTWSTPVTITKGVTLTGAGVGSTIITSSGGSVLIAGAPDATSITNSDNIKITGFTFDGGNSACTLMALAGASGISGTKPYRYYIIGNNTFQNGCTSGNGIIEMPADSNGQLRGVIYSNTFDRCNIIIRPFSNDDTREWTNTAFNQLAFGNEDTLYFEGNTIQFSTSFSGDNPGWSESGQGGRIVIRYNTYNLLHATTPQEIWDIHGFQNWTGTVDSGQTSTMISEYYGNTLSNMGTYRWINHRGSWGLFFDNILTGTGGNSIDLYGMSPGASCPADINPTPVGYNPLVNNSYFWNNTQGGTITNALPYNGGSGFPNCTVAQNAYWWNYSASCTTSACTAGIGRGTTAPTGSCTTGVGYWVSPTPTPTASSAVIQASTLYKCTSTNTWTAYYTPYTYPHPLTGGAPAATITPSSFPAGTVTQVYSQTLTSANFSGTVTWSRTAGTLPPGLSDCTGTGTTKVLSGTLTTAGSYSWTCHGTDGTNTADDAITMTVNSAPSITTSSPLPEGAAGVAYSQTLTASPTGTTPDTWSVSAGTVPTGTSLSSSGVLSGTPSTVTGSPFSFTARVVDSNSIANTKAFSVTIGTVPTITTTSPLTAGIVGSAYSTQFAATGDTPITWTATGVPGGLSLSSSGLLSGTPNAAATSTIQVTATNAAGTQSSAPTAFSITISTGLAVPHSTFSGTQIIRGTQVIK